MKFTDNSDVLDLIQGVHIPLLAIQLSTPFTLKLLQEELDAITSQVNTFQTTGIIVPAQHSDGGVHLQYLPIPYREVRLILDLTVFNDSLKIKTLG